MSTIEYGVIFDEVNQEVEKNQTIVDQFREQIKLVDEGYRHVAKLMAPMHTEKPSSLEHIGQNAADSQQFTDMVDVLTGLMNLVSSHPYYKYNNLWSHSVQNVVYVKLLTHWLAHRSLLSPEEVAQSLKVGMFKTEAGHGSGISLEEYLHATITLVNELSRLAVNSVTSTAAANAGQPGSETYNLPVEIDRFMKQLQAGFMTLNLKNDSLRRRSDSIKYDVKKVEEIVYDLALRGLITR